MIYRVLSILALIVVLGVGFILVDREPNDTPSRNGNGVAVEDPGYASRNAEIIETGEDGRPMYTLRAAVIRQMLNSETVTLEDVQMEFRDGEGNRWTARADRGQILQDAAHVHLAGAVRVSGVLPGTEQPAQIATDQLSFDTRSEVVKTQAPVTLDWAGGQLRGLGLVASLKTHMVRLESSVHGRFPP